MLPSSSLRLSPAIARQCAGAALSLVLTVAAACARLPIRMDQGYPAVGFGVGLVVGPRGDTLWTRQVGMITLVSRAHAAVDSLSYAALEGSADVHQRLLGAPAQAMTAVLLRTAGQ